MTPVKKADIVGISTIFWQASKTMKHFQPYIPGLEQFMEQLELQAAKVSKQDVKKLDNSQEQKPETKQ